MKKKSPILTHLIAHLFMSYDEYSNFFIFIFLLAQFIRVRCENKNKKNFMGIFCCFDELKKRNTKMLVKFEMKSRVVDQRRSKETQYSDPLHVYQKIVVLSMIPFNYMFACHLSTSHQAFDVVPEREKKSCRRSVSFAFRKVI